MKRQKLYGIVAVLFIISGAAGLAYQIVWFKYLSLFLGNTTYAQTVVLATFMGGLAIGASLWGRRADRSRKPLTLYALLELGIGAYCLLYPSLLGFLKRAFVETVLALDLPSDGDAVLFLKLLTSLATLLLPTILMGGTLPVLVRFISHRVEDSGKNVATLYFLNSFGAVVGSMLGGFFMIPAIGLSTSIYSVAIINIAVGAAAFALGLRRIDKPAAQEQQESVPEVQFTERQELLALFTAGASGFAAMVYEVTWVRLLIPVLGSSTYSYTLMLVGFITGITIGSLIVSNLFSRMRNIFGLLAACQLGVGISMVLTLPLYGRVPYYFWLVGRSLYRDESTYPIYLTVQFIFGFAIMLVPTIFLGMTLPVASRIASRNIQVLGRSVGNVFSINTLGTVLGSIAAGLILIPLIGAKHAIEVGVGINLITGLVLLYADTNTAKIRRGFLLATSAVAVAVYFLVVPNWSHSVMVSGVFRHISRNKPSPSSFEEFLRASEANKVVFYREGITATVAVTEANDQIGPQNILIINGKSDASSRGDLPTQVLLGQIPLFLHPRVDTAMVIGLGSGVTVGSILTHPVKLVDCVEISPEVIDASKLFDNFNNRPLEDPRTHLFVDDALSFLKLTRHSYDVLVSEPSNPWIAGVGNLYTKEFFKECRARLRENGLMVQWFHLYEMDDEVFSLVIRTFQSVFPYTSVWQPLSSDVILIGSTRPLELNSVVDKKFENDAVRNDLERIHIHDVASLLSLQRLSEESVTDFVTAGPTNSEDLPLLEYWAPRAFFVNRGVETFGKHDERMTFGGATILLKKRIQKEPLTDQEQWNIGQLHSEERRGNLVLGYSMLNGFLATHPNDVDALKLLAKVTEQMGRREESLQYRERLLKLLPNDYEVMGEYAWLKFLYRRGVTSTLDKIDFAESEQLLKRCVELEGDTNYYYRTRLADFYFGVQDYARAVDYFQQANRTRKGRYPDVRIRDDILLLQLAKSLHFVGQDNWAIGYALQAVNANHNNEEAKDLVYLIWTRGTKVPKDTSSVHH